MLGGLIVRIQCPFLSKVAVEGSQIHPQIHQGSLTWWQGVGQDLLLSKDLCLSSWDTKEHLVSLDFGPPTTKDDGLHPVLTDSPLEYFLQSLTQLNLSGIKSPWLIHYGTQTWPLYPLGNQCKRPYNGSLDPSISQDCFCEYAGKWKDILYVSAFSFLHPKSSLYISC